MTNNSCLSGYRPFVNLISHNTRATPPVPMGSRTTLDLPLDSAQLLRAANSFTFTNPAAFRLAPDSSACVYVMTRRYPIAFAARDTAPYSIEFALAVPSVQVRFTSSVRPSSNARATGRPAIATPTCLSAPQSAMLNLWPRGGLLCRCSSATKAQACRKVAGLIFMAIGF